MRRAHVNSENRERVKTEDQTPRPRNFAVIGAAGYIAPRHLKAIAETGNRLVAAVDLHDAAGVLDSFSLDVKFFVEIERFDRHLEQLRRRLAGEQVDIVSICSPNYLHDAHCRLALRAGADAICEKPLVINPWNLDALSEIEAETGHRINTVLQLRLHPRLVELREQLHAVPAASREVILTYVTARGPWYFRSWKGDVEKSGGIAVNIGIHLFDMLTWLFGPPVEFRVHLSEAARSAGLLELERARVRWFLSVCADDLPAMARASGQRTYRALRIDGVETDVSDGFADLHTRVYEEVLAGRGFRIGDVRPSVELVHAIRTASVTSCEGDAHPYLAERVLG